MSYSPVRMGQQQRLTDPMVWRYGQMQPTSWEDALDLVARVTAAVINEQGEDGLFVSAFDHGGAGGGYENAGHREALLRRDEGEEHPHSQPSGLQLGGPRDPGHGRRRAQQLLRGCAARGHDRGRGSELSRDADELLPEPLVPNLRGISMDKRGPSSATSRSSPGA